MLGSARAVVYFSEYEGFGMPPVEAILVGHVLYFQTSSAPGDHGRRRLLIFQFFLASFSQALNRALAPLKPTCRVGRPLAREASMGKSGRQVLVDPDRIGKVRRC